jgi:hypothetical protein
VSEIGEALDRLLAAYAAAGGTTGDLDPADEAELDALRDLVAPQRLPSEIEYLWRHFQEQGVPGILDTNSLETVEVAAGAARYSHQSRALLTIGSGSSTCYLDLDDADGTGGGAVWTLVEFAPEMREVAPSLAALLDSTAIAWEQGIVRLSEKHPFPWAAWDDDAWVRLKSETLPAGRVVGSRPVGWLPRWLTAEGLTRADVVPRGPTTRIAELLTHRESWTGTETVRGVVASAVQSTTAARLVIHDGSGELVLYVPHDADPFRLLTLGTEAEIDVRRFPARMDVEPPFDASAFDARALAARDA